MFLKQLDTVGFKSFAERTKIDFVSGVTAVVGPNGSGKSNIIDAVRWVLGEQSAKSLRGQKMEDIIFQGSDTRHPLNFAEVTLVLNNSTKELPVDYDEVSVTRRVFRSGESEFYINKQACRLKDIIDLFLDSGLGKEAFTIIGQGKVEEILSSKAEERRTIFEEAAGVLKYKQRKRQAEYKLIDTEDNLDRVEDIVFEIEQQIDPLKEQAEKAKVYKDKSASLKDKEISLLVTEITEKHSAWQKTLKELDSLKEKEDELNIKIKAQDASLLNKKSQLEKINQALSILQKKQVEAIEILEKKEGQRDVLKERLKHFDENKLNLDKELKELSSKSKQIKSDLKLTQETLQETRDLYHQVEKEKNQISSELNEKEDRLIEAIEDLKADYIEKLNERAVKKNEYEVTKSRIEKINKQTETSEATESDNILRRDALSEQKSQEIEKIDALTKEIKELEASIQFSITEIRKKQTKFNENHIKLSKANEQIAKLTTRIDTLKEMRDSYQGYFYGVKELLKAAKQNEVDGVKGAVIDLIKVPTGYLSAIDIVLGGQSQHIVVQDEQAARESIAWLKSHNKGRATFLPLTTIKGRKIARQAIEQIESHPDFLAIASDVVEVESSYQQVIEHLIGNVILAKTLKGANEIAQLIQRRYRIVTLDGDIVFPGGSMSGGAKRKNNQSLFTREKELKELTLKLADYVERTNAFNLKIKEERELIEKLEKDVQNDQVKLNALKEKLIEMNKQHERTLDALRKLNDGLIAYDLSVTQSRSEIQELRQGLTELEAELKQVNDLIEENESQVTNLTKQLTSQKNKREKLESDLQSKLIKLAEFEEKIKHLKETEARFQASYLETVNQIDSVQRDLENMRSLHGKEVTEEEIEGQINQLKNSRYQIENNLKKSEKERTELAQKINDAELELKQETLKFDKLKQTIQDKEVKVNRLDVALETNLTRLQTEYVITYERAQELYPVLTSVEETKKEISYLKNTIKNLGTVNLGAIEEYRRIEERYTFLSKQQTDLLEAKKTLYDVIAEMDAEMIHLFSTTFNQIQAEFSVVFKELFGGGHAELNLTDPNNLLETGIEIIAQPPGKKLRTLGLLSGGERALTAIALLFSILNVRPVPFCILDEVEAALDEANVQRFAKYVKMHSEETQFIVITHRRGTMEEADVLYGVTMQESGVSRLVSVKLEEAEEIVS